MKLKPLSDRVLIRVGFIDEVTEGGIYLPDEAKEEKPEGEVIAIGNDVTDLKIGDKVLYSLEDGSEIEFNGAKHRIIRQDEIVAKIEIEKEKVN